MLMIIVDLLPIIVTDTDTVYPIMTEQLQTPILCEIDCFTYIYILQPPHVVEMMKKSGMNPEMMMSMMKPPSMDGSSDGPPAV